MNVQNVGNNQPINPNVGNPEQTNVNMGEMPVQQPAQTIPNPETVGQAPANMGVPQNQVPQTPVEAAPVNNENVGIPAGTANNIMEDFSQAVVPEPVTPTGNVSQPIPTEAPINPMPTAVPNSAVVETETSVSAPIPEQGNVGPMTPVDNNAVAKAETPTATTEIVPNQPEATTLSENETIVPADGTPNKKKKGNWAFIVALFAIVGFFVLLLPLLVRIFGY